MGLAHDFSSALLERPPFPPETLLFFSRSGMHSLHLETAHTYPNEGLVVSTSSRLTVSDGNAFREMLARKGAKPLFSSEEQRLFTGNHGGAKPLSSPYRCLTNMAFR